MKAAIQAPQGGAACGLGPGDLFQVSRQTDTAGPDSQPTPIAKQSSPVEPPARAAADTDRPALRKGPESIGDVELTDRRIRKGPESSNDAELTDRRIRKGPECSDDAELTDRHVRKATWASPPRAPATGSPRWINVGGRWQPTRIGARRILAGPPQPGALDRPVLGPGKVLDRRIRGPGEAREEAPAARAAAAEEMAVHTSACATVGAAAAASVREHTCNDELQAWQIDRQGKERAPGAQVAAGGAAASPMRQAANASARQQELDARQVADLSVWQQEPGAGQAADLSVWQQEPGQATSTAAPAAAAVEGPAAVETDADVVGGLAQQEVRVHGSIGHLGQSATRCFFGASGGRERSSKGVLRSKGAPPYPETI
jgi:hypothetical protein